MTANKYAGICQDCRQPVAAGKGNLYRYSGANNHRATFSRSGESINVKRFKPRLGSDTAFVVRCNDCAEKRGDKAMKSATPPAPRLTLTIESPNRAFVSGVPGVSKVELYRFSGQFPTINGVHCPWHIVCSGSFWASPEAAMAHLQRGLERPTSGGCSGVTYTSYGANSHAPCGN